MHERPHQHSEVHPQRATRGHAAPQGERSPAELLRIHGMVTELLASPLGIEDIAPLVLECLVRELELAGAELWVERGPALPPHGARRWLVEAADEAVPHGWSGTCAGTDNGPPGRCSPPEAVARHCGLELPLVAAHGVHGVLRVYAHGSRRIEGPTLQLVLALGRQMTRVIECDALAARLAACHGSTSSHPAPPELASSGAGTLRAKSGAPREVSTLGTGARSSDPYEARLRSLASDLLLAEERERRQLALDLHDGLSQTLALIRIRLAKLERTARSQDRAALAAIDQLVEQANRAARSVTFELSPPVLHDLGLEPALEWLTQNIKERYGIAVRFEHDDAPDSTDERTRIILFRSVRELLINAAKHSQARSVTLSFRNEDGTLIATVTDDGKGMDAEAPTQGGTGLLSITERMHHIGGRISIESEYGRGTRIELRAPASGAPSRQLETTP